MGYTLVEDGWVRRVKTADTPVQAEPPVEPTETQSTDPSNLQQIQQDLKGLKNMVTVMKEQVDNISDVTKETSTDMAKRMMDMGATKRQGIRAFNSMTNKMDKLTKEVETTYDSFCTKVINTLKYFLGGSKAYCVCRIKQFFWYC